MADSSHPPAPGAPPQKSSKKPIIFFLLAVLGVPYAMTKFSRTLAYRQQEHQALLGAPLPLLNFSTLTFTRARSTPSS